MDLAIDARGLRKRFGRTDVLDGLDLAVAAGTVFALLGPNGAGKTTTINILTTLVRPDAGTRAGRGLRRRRRARRGQAAHRPHRPVRRRRRGAHGRPRTSS